MNTTKKFFSLAVLFSVGLTASLAAESEVPKPAPEMQKYAPFLGVWKYDGEAKATPIGKAGRMSGTSTNRMALRGFVMESRWRDDVNPDFGSLDGMDFHTYDASKKTYLVQYYDSIGGSSSGSESVTGNTWSGTGGFTGPKGEAVKVRNKAVFSADGKTIAGTWEISVDDGKNWQPWFALTSKKVSN